MSEAAVLDRSAWLFAADGPLSEAAVASRSCQRELSTPVESNSRGGKQPRILPAMRALSSAVGVEGGIGGKAACSAVRVSDQI